MNRRRNELLAGTCPPGGVLVFADEDLVDRFEEVNLGAEAGEGLRELTADGPSADDKETLG